VETLRDRFDLPWREELKRESRELLARERLEELRDLVDQNVTACRAMLGLPPRSTELAE